MTDIEDRTAEYAIRAVALYRHLQQLGDGAGLIFAKQYLRSATSIGANMSEAQAGESRADFIHKCSIAQKEAKESRYWLKLMLRAELVAPKRLTPLLQETEEIVAIITTIIVNAKKGVSK
jgi:four helix bundle protein